MQRGHQSSITLYLTPLGLSPHQLAPCRSPVSSDTPLSILGRRVLLSPILKERGWGQAPPNCREHMPGRQPQNPCEQAAPPISPHSLSKNMWENPVWPPEPWACSSHPNGSMAPGFLLPLHHCLGHSHSYSGFESCQEKPNSYFQTPVLAKPEIVIACRVPKSWALSAAET